MDKLNVRNALDKELQALETDLLRLGTLAEDAVNQATWALREQDVPLAYKIIAADDRVDDLTMKVERDALQIIARYQPVAQDLRFISAALFMASNLERIADHGVSIARAACEVAGEKHVKPLIDVPAMAELLKEMVDTALRAYLDKDIAMARSVCAMDDRMDDLEQQIFRELLVLMMGNPRTIRPATTLIGVARTLERAGDHATNLAERIIYMVSGKVERASEHRRPKPERKDCGIVDEE